MKTVFLPLFCALSFAASAIAGPTPIALDPLEETDARLEIRNAEGRATVLGLAKIEMVQTYQLVTTTPWRSEPAVFEGVLLRDLLQSFGLEDQNRLLVTAENDYAVTFERSVWMESDLMVATRVNGNPISRRERGPILFVIDADDYLTNGVVREDHLVWMAAEIEPAN